MNSSSVPSLHHDDYFDGSLSRPQPHGGVCSGVAHHHPRHTKTHRAINDGGSSSGIGSGGASVRRLTKSGRVTSGLGGNMVPTVFDYNASPLSLTVASSSPPSLSSGTQVITGESILSSPPFHHHQVL